MRIKAVAARALIVNLGLNTTATGRYSAVNPPLFPCPDLAGLKKYDHTLEHT
jgi:hypothetical protein